MAKMPPVDGRSLKRKLKPLHTSIRAVPRTAGIVMTAKTDAGGDRTALQDEFQAYLQLSARSSGCQFERCH